MELKKKFVLRNIVGETILVPIGQDNEAFNANTNRRNSSTF
mgnify:CR=1 FL=1